MPKGELICEECGHYESECQCSEVENCPFDWENSLTIKYRKDEVASPQEVRRCLDD